MKELPYYFIGSAVVFALAGMSFGIFMAASGDHTLAGAHAHANLLGWVGMAIFGLYYRATPVAITRLATFHLAVTLIANLIFPIGIALVLLGNTPKLAAAGSTLEIVSMAIFGFIVWQHRQALGDGDIPVRMGMQA